MQWDVEAVRSRFPALQECYGRRQAIFLDAPGGTQVPGCVVDSMGDYLIRRNANVHGEFETSRRTDQTILEAHQAVADLLGADPDEVVFGANMTTLTFHLSRSLAREFSAGDELIVTRLDHDANISPWLLLAEDTGATVRWADFDPETCRLDLRDLQSKITPRTRLIAVGLASNATGSVNDVATIGEWARQAGAYLFVDAVQYAPHRAIDVRSLGCDFLACSSYKYFGPHAGQLFGKRDHLERLPAYKVRPATDQLPFRWETGTQNHEGMAGVTAAVDYLAALGSGPDSADRRLRLQSAWQRIADYERGLTLHLLKGLKSIPGVTIYGVTEEEQIDCRLPTFALRKEGSSPAGLARRLGEAGIFCWSGNFYALAVTERLGLESCGGLLRVGLVHYNTAQEVDRFLDVLSG